MRTNIIAIAGNASLLTLLAFLLMPEWSRAVQGQDADTAVGQPVKRFIQEWADESRTHVITREATDQDQADPQAVSYNYDNWNQPGFGGISLPIRNVRTGGNETGDDLQLVNNTGGRLSGAGWSLANLASSGILSRWTQTYRWYDENRTLIRSFSFITDVGSLGVRPGEGVLLGQVDGFWTGFNIILPNRSYMSVQFSNVSGIDISDVGVTLWGPITLGASERTYYDFTTRQSIDPGANGQNLGAFIRSEIVPASGTVVIVSTFATLAGCRRRYRE